MTKDNLISLIEMAVVELKKLGSKENDLLFAIKNAYGYLMAEQFRQAAVSGSVCVCEGGAKGRTVDEDYEQICEACGRRAN